MVYVNIDASKD